MALDKLTQITTSGINSTTPLSGINVTGIITASSLSVSGITTGAAATFDSVDVLGVLTYDDVTNVDALGIVTARSGVRVTGGSIGIGTDNPTKDLTITGNNPGILLKEDNANSELVLTVSDSDGTGVIAATRPSNYTYEQLAIRGQDLIFETTSTQSRVERLRITSGGNVGIGTQIPAGKFQVGSNGSSNVIITENIGVDINDGAFNLYQATSNVNAAPFILSSDVGGTEVEKVRINAAGNVGIGTALTGASSNTKLTLQTTDSSACRLVLSNSGSSTAESTQIWSQNDELAFNAGGSERLRVSAGGYVLKSNHPCFDAVRNSGHLSSATYINYNTVKANNGGHYDSSNGRFTAPVAGYYFFSWGTIKNNDSATVARLHIHKNGVEAYGGRHLRMDSGQAYGDNGAMTVVIQLAKDDYIQIYLTAGSVYGVTEEYCFFNGYLLG